MEGKRVNSPQIGQRPGRFAGEAESTNLRDLLKVREDEAINPSESKETMTLATVLACEKQLHSTSNGINEAPSSSQTLLDVIHLDENPDRIVVASKDRRADGLHNGISWKAFKSFIGLRRTTMWPNVSASTPSINHPTSPNVGAMETTVAPTSSGDDPITSSVSEVGLNWSFTIREHMGTEDSPTSQDEGPVRVSLMALLEESDRNGGNNNVGRVGPSFRATMMGMVEEDEREEEETTSKDVGDIATMAKDGILYFCCVCMVRHKGAAFIPCGHTFCRVCSRELWVSRGNCPLCNGFILEILDIF